MSGDATKVLWCTCAHAFQDARYGNGLRLHNRRKPRDIEALWRCTVCGRDK